MKAIKKHFQLNNVLSSMAKNRKNWNYCKYTILY